MKIEVELVSRQRSDHTSMDVEVAVTATGNELEVIQHAGIRLAHPQHGSSSTRDMLRQLFGTQGDLFRELGIANYKTFQPDYNYFNSSSEGWQRFVVRVAADAQREETLKRFAHIIGGRIRLFTQSFPPAVYETPIGGPIPPIPVSVGDLSPTSMEIRIGKKIYRASAVEDKQTTLVASAIEEVKIDAASKIASMQSECSHGLELLKAQYERRLQELETKYAHMMEAPVLSTRLRQEGILYTANPGEGSHIFFIPIKIEPLFVQGKNDIVRWKLKKEYIIKQKAWLQITTDSKLNVKHGKLLDIKFEDTVQQWHHSGGGICWGSYAPKIGVLDDLLKVRDDVATMLQTINLQSIGARNLTGPYSEMYHIMRIEPERFSEPEFDEREVDLQKIATRIPYNGGAWAVGDTWST